MTDTGVRKVGDNLADDLRGETEYSCELVEFASSNCFPLVIYESRFDVVGCEGFRSTVRSEGGWKHRLSITYATLRAFDALFSMCIAGHSVTATRCPRGSFARV